MNLFSVGSTSRTHVSLFSRGAAQDRSLGREAVVYILAANKPRKGRKNLSPLRGSFSGTYGNHALTGEATVFRRSAAEEIRQSGGKQ